MKIISIKTLLKMVHGLIWIEIIVLNFMILIFPKKFLNLLKLKNCLK